VKIRIADLPSKRNEEKLLGAMGWETANVHLGSGRRAALRRDMERRTGDWLCDTCERMAAATMADWTRWLQTA